VEIYYGGMPRTDGGNVPLGAVGQFSILEGLKGMSLSTIPKA